MAPVLAVAGVKDSVFVVADMLAKQKVGRFASAMSCLVKHSCTTDCEEATTTRREPNQGEKTRIFGLFFFFYFSVFFNINFKHR